MTRQETDANSQYARPFLSLPPSLGRWSIPRMANLEVALRRVRTAEEYREAIVNNVAADCAYR